MTIEVLCVTLRLKVVYLVMIVVKLDGQTVKWRGRVLQLHRSEAPTHIEERFVVGPRNRQNDITVELPAILPHILIVIVHLELNALSLATSQLVSLCFATAGPVTSDVDSIRGDRLRNPKKHGDNSQREALHSTLCPLFVSLIF